MKRLGPRFARCVLGAVVSSQMLGCGPKSHDGSATPEGDLQSICGPTSELRDVELYDGGFGLSTAFVNRHRLAVGLLKWRGDLYDRYREQSGTVAGWGWCTGTLIDDDLFLTAGHCLDNSNTAHYRLPHEKDGTPLDPPEIAREFEVQFRYETPARSVADSYGSVVGVARLEEYSRTNPDYALLRLSGPAGLNNGVARISPTDSQPGWRIALLQHPRAEPMQVASGPVARLLGPKITYDSIDTLDGSSGAGILDAVTGKLVGIHTNGGCTHEGDGENYGVTIGALATASKFLRESADRSRDFLVGDWNADGFSDLAVFVNGCLYPDVDRDGVPDAAFRQCPVEPNADQYFVGKWQRDGASRLGWRVRDCVYLDVNPQQRMCFDAPFEVMVADWDGDGQSDLGIRKGPCISFDLDLDGVLDGPAYCYGNGIAEDEYLVGHWAGGLRDSIAIRRANTVLLDVDSDGIQDTTQLVFGRGGNEDQYLVGDWSGSGRSELAVRRGTSCAISVADGSNGDTRFFRDFWSKP